MSCTTVPESQSSLESPECGRSAAEATSQTLKKSSAWIQNIFPSGISDWMSVYLENMDPLISYDEELLNRLTNARNTDVGNWGQTPLG